MSAEEDAAALVTLPTLRKLTLVAVRLHHADFVQHLPALTSLTIGFIVEEGANAVDIPRVMAALQTCAQLIELKLWGFSGFDYTSEQLASCLERMPRLQTLAVASCNALHSLSFLAAGTLAATLTTLEIGNCNKRIPIAELHKVHALRGLRTLSLSPNTFDEPLSAFIQQLYTPPSYVLPALTTFRSNNPL